MFKNMETIKQNPSFFVLTLSFLFFQFLLKVLNRVSLYSKHKPDSKFFENLNLWAYRNLIISWIHAAVAGVWVVYCFADFWEMTYDFIGFYNYPTLFLSAFSSGYFLHDLCDIVLNKQYSHWEVCIHHLCVILMFTYNLAIRKFIGYTVLCILAEVNSVFLHLRRIMKHHGVTRSSPYYRLNAVVNIATYVVCRFPAIICIMYGIVHHSSQATPVYFVCLLVCSFLMICINLILFWRLLRSDFLSNKSPPTPVKTPPLSLPNGYEHGTLVSSKSNVK